MFLVSGDQYYTATMYDNLGLLAQELQRYEAAVDSFRKALDIWLDLDPRKGSGTASQLVPMLAKLGRYAEATRFLVRTAGSWHQQNGHWSPCAPASTPIDTQANWFP